MGVKIMEREGKQKRDGSRKRRKFNKRKRDEGNVKET
jgi:hypothetical protein